jgi:hypothetical protein
MSLFDATVDLNPHQIEAALFALHSPPSKGVILADEVGLGKTIEAGIVLCQYWAERKDGYSYCVQPQSATNGLWSFKRNSTFPLLSLIQRRTVKRRKTATFRSRKRRWQ